MDIAPYKKPEYFRNRELSWVSFDERVLNEARDKSIPLFERLKFISITSSNLDEFYMVRVASLKDQVHANYTKKDLSGMDAKEQLAGISKRTHELVQLQYNTYNRSAVPSLEHVGLTIISEHEKLTKEQAEYVDSYFEENIYPVLTPMAMDSARPFPLIRNKTLNIGALVQKKEDSLLSRAEDKKEKKGKEKEKRKNWNLRRFRFLRYCRVLSCFRRMKRRGPAVCDSSGGDHRAEHWKAVLKLRCGLRASVPCHAECGSFDRRG